MVSRTDRGIVADWWWTVDKPLLAALVTLMVGGVVLSLAGSPPVAERLGLETFFFFKRHVLFFIPALAVLFAASFLDARQARRLAIVLFLVMAALMLATLMIGEEIKGARRWINFGPLSIQPSEFMKPAFVVLAAWLMSENTRQAQIPGKIFAFLLFGVVGALLIAQPDFGQTLLVGTAWAALFFLAGMPLLWIVAIGLGGVGAATVAYMTVPHVAGRIDRFFNPQEHDTFQVDTALESFLRGGWLGSGPGEGTIKKILPDSHTDFIFAAAAEEFGVVLCIALTLLFAFVVLRGLLHALRLSDSFSRLAVAGLVIVFGIQSVINMAVNLSLMPAKGMTLPFISYGGSSMLAVALEMGLLLALTRRRPEQQSLLRGMAAVRGAAVRAG
ncbi:MAG: putative lipid II flippase FtsW [Bauldia sp.]